MDGLAYLSNSLRISDLASELRSSPYTAMLGGMRGFRGRKTGPGHLHGFEEIHIS